MRNGIVTTPSANSPINSTIKAPNQIWTGGSGIEPFIFNNDVANTMYIGAQRDVLTQSISSCIPLAPLQGIAWPDVDVWAFALQTINYLIIPGATAFAPSPVQVQLALIAAGVSTAANQAAQITGQNTQIGQAASLANQPGSLAANPNPFFTNPNTGNADDSSWGNFGAALTVQTAGVNGAVSLPAGSGYANGVKLTCNASASTNNMGIQNPIGTGQCAYKDVIAVHAGLLPNVTPASYVGFIEVTFFNAANADIGQTQIPTTPTNNAWFQASGTVTAPVNAVTYAVGAGVATFSATDFTLGDSCYVVACIGYNSSRQGSIHSDIALAHANQGTPLLHGIDYVEGPIATVLVGAASSASVTIPFLKPGYVISVSALVANSLSTIPFMTADMHWTDSTGAAFFGRVKYCFPMTQSGTFTVGGSGPVRGPFGILTFTNHDPTYGATVTVSVIETTQHIARDDWRGPLEGDPSLVGVIPIYNGGTNFAPTGDVARATFANINSGVIPNNTTDTFLLPLYTGDVGFTFSATAGLNITIRPPTQLANVEGIGDEAMYNATNVTNVAIGELMPRVTCVFTVNNTSGGNVNFSIQSTILEYTS